MGDIEELKAICDLSAESHGLYPPEKYLSLDMDDITNALLQGIVWEGDDDKPHFDKRTFDRLKKIGLSPRRDAFEIVEIKSGIDRPSD